MTKAELNETKPRYGIVNFERRRYPRLTIDLPIEYHRVNSSKEETGQTPDSSTGGLLVHLPERAEIGDYLKLRLFIPSGRDLDSIEMITQVAWTDIHLGEDRGDCRSGVRFVEISAEDLDKLKDFLWSLSA